MAKVKTAYVCSDCGAHAVKWQGQCPDCDAWNTLTQVMLAGAAPESGSAARPSVLSELETRAELRLRSGFAEFDRVLGGGIVPGSVVLLGGDPGVGKSTLLQQVAARLPEESQVVYATGEESLQQLADRAFRLGVENQALRLLSDSSLDNILEQARGGGAQVVVIDSIQTMSVAEVTSAPGSVSQLRECVSRIVAFAKQNEIAVLLIGHVTKEGAIAGPRVVEHMVDTVLYFESEPGSRYTVIRAVKNRFGAISEMGVFAMTESGFREVSNPSAIFLSRNDAGGPGSIVTTTWEGSRPLLVEIQALVAESNHPRRFAQGIEQNRLAMLVAILQRHGGIMLSGEDIFVNVVGGMKINETAADLPAALAIASSFRDRSCKPGLIAFGETGLAGEVRPVRFGEERVQEAAKQGFRTVILPKANVPRNNVPGIDVVGVSNLAEALDEAIS